MNEEGNNENQSHYSLDKEEMSKAKMTCFIKVLVFHQINPSISLSNNFFVIYFPKLSQKSIKIFKSYLFFGQIVNLMSYLDNVGYDDDEEEYEEEEEDYVMMEE